jgi:hypothetical protein
MVRTLLAAGVAVAASAAIMFVQSGDLVANRLIPKTFMAVACGGENHSPSLAWNGAPQSTQSFAIIMHDPDAPMPGGFYHWVVYNLSSATHRLGRDAKLTAGQLGVTSARRAEYHGPCPPPGPAHHYTFTVYALDLPHVTAAAPLSGPELEHAIAGHVVARGVFEATAETTR